MHDHTLRQIDPFGQQIWVEYHPETESQLAAQPFWYAMDVQEK